jgi:outer membrane protein assembly factor BamD
LAVVSLIFWLVAGCTFTWPWTKKYDMTRATPDGLYQQGVEAYREKNYKRAVDLFQRLKDEYPLSKYAIAAEIGIADSYFSAEDYNDAELAYSEFINLHPTNENLPYAMYQLGMSHFSQLTTIDRDQSETIKALKEFERLTTRFPDSKFTFLAEKKIRECRNILGEQEFYIGEFYFKNGRYQAALRRFETVAREYANAGLDYKVSYYILETKRRLAEEADRKKK